MLADVIKVHVFCVILACALLMAPMALLASSSEQLADTATNDNPEPSPILQSLQKLDSLRLEILAIEEEEKRSGIKGDALDTLRLKSLEKNKFLVTELQELHIEVNNFVADGGDLNALLKPYESRILREGASLRSDIDYHIEQEQSHSAILNTLTSAGLKTYKLDASRVTTSIAVLDEYIGLVKAMQFAAGPSERFIKPALEQRLERVAGYIRLSFERESDIAEKLAIDKENVEFKNQQVLIQDKLRFDSQNLHLIMSIAEHYGIDVTAYHSFLIRSTGEISIKLLDPDVLAAFFNEWWREVKFDIRKNLANYILKFVVVVLILLGFHLLARTINHLIARSVATGRLKITVLMQDMLIVMTKRTMMFIGILVALSQLGVSLGPVLAGLGVAGFVVGFALQDTLGNFASGLMILLCRPYDVGDVVEGGGVFGKVKSMSIVSTTILTFDNQTLIIPNSKIWGDVIKNVTAQRMRRVDMEFGVSYGDNIEHVEQVISDIVTTHEKVLKDPEPIIKLHKLNDSSIDFVVRPWVRTDDYWEVYWDITRTIKLRFDQEGISIPFPQRDVHIFNTKDSQPAITPGSRPSAI